MRKVLVTGSDTGVGKTHVVATLARLLSDERARVQIVKVVETGRKGGGDEGDAAVAQRLSGADLATFTLATFPAALAPTAAASAAGKELSIETLVAEVGALPDCDWRIFEGAGGIATPVDASSRDWADFAEAVDANAVIVVVPDRLGAINQARLAFARAAERKLHAGVWLNAVGSVDPEVAASNRDGLRTAGIPIWAEQAHRALSPQRPDALRAQLIDRKSVV